jgi:hypothetical protein
MTQLNLDEKFSFQYLYTLRLLPYSFTSIKPVYWISNSDRKDDY